MNTVFQIPQNCFLYLLFIFGISGRFSFRALIDITPYFACEENAHIFHEAFSILPA
jgi:hypothetical protein